MLNLREQARLAKRRAAEKGLSWDAQADAASDVWEHVVRKALATFDCTEPNCARCHYNKEYIKELMNRE